MSLPWTWETKFACVCHGALDQHMQPVDTFQNFWLIPGECCDNLRFTLWLIFNAIFMMMACRMWYTIRGERLAFKAKLYDFNMTERGKKMPVRRLSEEMIDENPLSDPFIG